MERPLINRNEYEWETFNTSIIKVVFNSFMIYKDDYGTRVRFKCHKRIQRKAKTLEGESCTNWDQIDGFGVRLDFDNSIHHTDRYKNFYDDPKTWDMDWWDVEGEGL